MRVNVDRVTGLVEFPVYHMRGGTSTGLVIWEPHAPKELALREELLRLLMGVPQSGSVENNNQLTGLGRISPTTNKVFFVDTVAQSTARPKVKSTLAQLASDHANIDWSVNCGNMSSAIPLFAFDRGILSPDIADPELEILNTNTGISTLARLNYTPSVGLTPVAIPGIRGKYPSTDLFLQNPVGAKTGKLLPTGQARERIQGIEVSCVDVAVPMVILKAADIGKTGFESIAELNADPALLPLLRNIWVEAGQRMSLENRDGTPMSTQQLQKSETIPKICFVSEPQHPNSQISVRYYTPQKLHSSLAVTGGCCLAAACLIKGSVAHEITGDIKPTSINGSQLETKVAIDNPAGTLETVIIHDSAAAETSISSAAYNRSAQILMKGWVPVWGASDNLLDSLREITDRENKP